MVDKKNLTSDFITFLIFVRDQDRRLRFYLEQLGFNLVIDYHFGQHGRFVLISPPNSAALLVALIAPKPDSENISSSVSSSSGFKAEAVRDAEPKQMNAITIRK
jgi:hypothetical protein